MLEGKGLLKKEGNRLVYTTVDGTEIKQFRKAWENNEEGCLDIAMKEISSSLKRLSNDVEETAEDPEVAPTLTVDGHGDVHEVTED